MNKKIDSDSTLLRASNEKRPAFRTGLVGAGYVSEYHIQGIERVDCARIVSVCDTDITRAETLERRLGCQAYTSLDEMLAAGVDVLHVMTPPSTHASITLAALEAGCHVFVEKPLATSAADCERITEAAERMRKNVCVCHSLLRDPFVVEALDLVKRGTIGEVMTFDYLRSTEFPPYAGGPLPPQYRDGGYLFRDIGVHALYLTQAFLGKIEQVNATFHGTGREPNLLYDQWRAHIQCERGSGQAHICTTVRPVQNQFVIQGTGGVLRADMFGLSVTTRQQTRLPSAVQRVANAMGESLQIATQVPQNVLRVMGKQLRSYHGLQQLIIEFYQSLADGRPSPVPPREAKPVVEWVERMARKADDAKRHYLDRFPKRPSADILITGATGFIGSYLLERLLAKGKRVRVLVRRPPSTALMDDPRIDVVLGDLGDPDAVDRAVRGTRLVYHVGAAMGGAAHDFERGTVAGTRNILSSVLRHSVRRLVYFSSLSVLHAAAARSSDKITEQWPLEPQPQLRGLYTQSKLKAELLVADAVKTLGLPAIIVRPGRVFGPGAPLLSPNIGRHWGSRLLVLGDGHIPLPLIYIEDLLDAVETAATKPGIEGRAFNLVDQEQVTQNEVAQLCVEHSSELSSMLHLPRPTLDALAAGATWVSNLLGRPSPVHPYQLRSALAPLSFDCSSAQDVLGWWPQVGTREGLRRTSGAPKQLSSHSHEQDASLITLMYHDVVPEGAQESSGFLGPSAAHYKLTTCQFEAHLDAIAQLDEPPVVAHTLVSGRRKQSMVLLSFDDGGRSAYGEIAERLEARGWRGHFFITCERIGEEGFVTAEQVRDLARRGHLIGSHSMTHPLRMASLSYTEILQEWRASLDVLEQILGERPTLASLPGGAYSQAVARAAAEAGIRLLFTSEPRTDAFAVDGCQVRGRFAIVADHNAHWVKRIVSGDRIHQFRQRALWETKKVAKRVGGRAYLQVREGLFRQRQPQS